MHIHSPIAPMLAATIQDIPGPSTCRGGCRYEPKWDGFRAMAHLNEHHGVTLYSRRGTRFNEAFSELVMALHDQLPAATVVDGEIIRWSEQGRLDFDALQRRLTAGWHARELARAEPCHMAVFDVLESESIDLRAEPLHVRRAVLEQLLGGAGPAARTYGELSTAAVTDAAAAASPQAGPRMLAFLAGQQAHAAAQHGDRTRALAKLQEAETALDRAESRAKALGSYDPAAMSYHISQVQYELGDLDNSIAAMEQSDRIRPPVYRRIRIRNLGILAER